MTDTTRESVEALADRLDGATCIVNQNDYMELVEVSPVLRALLSERDAARTALAAAEDREKELRGKLSAAEANLQAVERAVRSNFYIHGLAIEGEGQ